MWWHSLNSHENQHKIVNYNLALFFFLLIMLEFEVKGRGVVSQISGDFSLLFDEFEAH